MRAVCQNPKSKRSDNGQVIYIIIIIISAVHATAGRWPPQLGCGVEPRNPPRWFRAAWWARQLSLRVDSLAMRQVVWGYILPIAGPKQNL